MSLVYLDNSNLNVLADAMSQSDDQFDRFLQIWRSLGCTLAVSRIHLDEIQNCEYYRDRKRRYELIQKLIPIRSHLPFPGRTRLEFDLVMMRELYLALMRLLGRQSEIEQYDRYWAGFPMVLTSIEVRLIPLVSEIPIVRSLKSAFHHARSLGASAKSRPRDEKYAPARLRKISEDVPENVDLDSALQELDRVFSDDNDWAALVRNWDPALVEKSKQEARDLMIGFVQRMRQVGPRRALEESVDAEPKRDDKQTVEYLIDRTVLRQQVQSCAREYLSELEPATVAELESKIELECCLGTWLRHLVRLEMEREDPVNPVSNEYDLEHVVHLPYVDVFFSDKRIAHFVRQAQRRDPQLSIWRQVLPPIHVSASVGAIIDALETGPPSWQ